MIWTLSEPFGARDWWPCKDFNDDKADSLDMTCTVPDNLIVASNGVLVSDVDNGSTRTFHWHTSSPISTYLVSLAIHPYTVFSDSYTPQGPGSPMELKFYVFPDHFSEVQATYALTNDMIDAFAESWGEYPFLSEKYGHAEFVVGGGMEHQTMSSLGNSTEDLISHELAHQWWGNTITCDTFHHIWLNEGFAVWSEAFWKEKTAGSAAYRDIMDIGAYFGEGTIYVENPNVDVIFDVNLSYNKGSWVVHMLRGVLGDEDFFDGLAHYRDLYEGATATTEQLRDAMEDVSGKDLDQFFQQWIYGQYYPHYRCTWSPIANGVDVTIDQIQTNTGLFEMPIRLRVLSTAGTFDFVVENSAASEDYSFSVAGTIQDVLVDPDRWILRKVETIVSNPTFDHGILLVNGVDWATYGTEITSAYADSSFWNDHPITFWDTFAEPAGGYPANLPEPLGHGSVPAGVLGQYSAVIWVGNNFVGDLVDWADTPILSYLNAGGNVLLMSRLGTSFLDPALAQYLGITWTSTGITLSNCTAQVPELTNIAFLGSQSSNDTFSPTVGPNSTLLYRDTGGANRGTGVIVEPPGGGSHRYNGGRMIFLAGRPYRMDHAQLRTNVDTMLTSYFGEPYTPPPTGLIFNSFWHADAGAYPNELCPWVLADAAAPEDPVLANDLLTLSTSDVSENLYYIQTSLLEIPDTLRISARLRVVAETHIEGNPRLGVAIAFTVAPDSANILWLGSDTVFLWSAFGTMGPTAVVDTDDALHTYTIEVVDHSAITVYQDDTAILTGAILASPNFANAPEIYWGDGTGNASAVSEWEFMRHNANTIPCGSAVAVPLAEAGSVGPIVSVTPYPNPTRGPLTFAVRNAAGIPSGRLNVYDVTGRTVRSLEIDRVVGGSTRVIWDTKDSSGREVSSGFYFVRLETAGQLSATEKVTILR
jgi:hypothetical protein